MGVPVLNLNRAFFWELKTSDCSVELTSKRVGTVVFKNFFCFVSPVFWLKFIQKPHCQRSQEVTSFCWRFQRNQSSFTALNKRFNFLPSHMKSVLRSSSNVIQERNCASCFEPVILVAGRVIIHLFFIGPKNFWSIIFNFYWLYLKLLGFTLESFYKLQYVIFFVRGVRISWAIYSAWLYLYLDIMSLLQPSFHKRELSCDGCGCSFLIYHLISIGNECFRLFNISCLLICKAIVLFDNEVCFLSCWYFILALIDFKLLSRTLRGGFLFRSSRAGIKYGFAVVKNWSDPKVFR